jgi:hypothetical protein
MLGTGSTMAASSNALPDEPLYPVKLFTEDMQRTVAVSPERKAQLETDIANIRAAELEAMANAGNTEQAIKAAERYDSQFEKAVQAIIKAGGTETAPVPAVSTPTTSSTTTSTTTPATSSTPTGVNQPSTVTAVSENTTATEGTTAPATVTSTTTAQNPPATQQPSTTNQQPSTTTTNDNGKATKIDNLKKALDNSTSRSLSALKDAQEKASDNTKSDWQSAYDKIKDKQSKWSQDKDTSASDNTTIQKDSYTKHDTSGQDNSSSRNQHGTHR